MAAVSFQVSKKLSLKNAILIVLLLLAGVFVLKIFDITSLHAKSASYSIALTDCYRAESFMRLAEIFELLPQSGLIIQSSKTVSNPKESVIEQATELLDEAVAEQPDSVVILCKKIILEAETKKNLKPDLDRLASICAAASEKKVSVQEQKLANLVLSLYGQNQDRSGSSEFLELNTHADNLLKSILSDGWYADSALLKLYKVENQNKKYEQLFSEIQNKNWQYLFKLMMVGVIATISAIVGVVIIIYQLIIHNNESSTHAEQNDVNSLAVSQSVYKFNWQIVTLVFLAWFFTQIFIAYISSVLRQKGLFISYASSLSTAISIALIYLLSNGSALLYIYFLAFKPIGLKLTEGLSLRLKVSNCGTIALVTIGLLGWFAAMPIVLAAHLISVHCFGSSGSSNPIISIVMKAALDNDFAAILLFYFTLGVLAAFCEESLFRGFLYGYLRGRHSSLLSNLLSSALFSILHFDPGAALQLFCLGSIFAYLREKTGSIVPSIIAHGIWNSANFTLVLLLLGN